MLLHRCSVCGKEFLPPGIHATWHKYIGRIPKHILEEFFCFCKPPRTEKSESHMTIDYNDLKQAIIEVGKEKKKEEQS